MLNEWCEREQATTRVVEGGLAATRTQRLSAFHPSLPPACRAQNLPGARQAQPQLSLSQMPSSQPALKSLALRPPLLSTSPMVPSPFPLFKRTQAQPLIYTGSRSVKARIDREVPLAEIIRQLAASSQLAVSEPAALFALREKETGELVTEDNLGKFLERALACVLVLSLSCRCVWRQS